MPTNTAAWLAAKQATLTVGPAPYTPPRANEIVIRNHAVAINPVDYMKQRAGDLMFSWIKYPFVLGSDLAGEVVEVGSAVSRFKVGDRVLAHAVGMDKTHNRAAEGAFQLHTVALEHMASPIPGSVSYEQAATLPLALSTAACGLFQQDQLALRYPSAKPEATGQTVLIWGGSTSVGSNAIQLAVAAGYEVITTASPHNFDYVKTLGACRAFDYNSPTVVEDVIAALKGKPLAGALSIGSGADRACIEIVRACDGRRFISMASIPTAVETLFRGMGQPWRLPLLLPEFVWSMGAMLIALRRHGIRTKSIFATTIMDNDVSHVIYEDFLPKALAEGRYIIAPAPYVVGRGLQCIQAGFETHQQGVSARKVVVSL